jgi:hypothetical protein
LFTSMCRPMSAGSPCQCRWSSSLISTVTHTSDRCPHAERCRPSAGPTPERQEAVGLLTRRSRLPSRFRR